MKTKLKVLAKVISLMICIGCTFYTCKKDPVKQDQRDKVEVKNGESDPFNYLESITFENGKEKIRTIEKLDESIYVKREYDKKEEQPKTYESYPEDKLHPLLKRYLEERDSNESIEIIIRFQDSLSIPRFPELKLDEDRNSAYNQAVIKASTSKGDELIKQRLREQERIIGAVKEYADRDN